MRIMSWNCHYGFGAKREKYLKIKEIKEIKEQPPQILIVQECTKIDFDSVKDEWEYKNWYNDDQKNNKSEIGVAIFSHGYKIGFTELFNRNFRYMIPYEVSKDAENIFTLFTVWINPIIDNTHHKHFFDAVKYYNEQKMLDKRSIIIGDFNTFAKNDNDLKILENELEPLVNCATNTKYRETHTYYHGKDKDGKDKTGIDDFCFASKDIADEIKITIPDDKWDNKQNKDHRWNGLSDHRPIIVDFLGLEPFGKNDFPYDESKLTEEDKKVTQDLMDWAKRSSS